jgi:hypothetical protein
MRRAHSSIKHAWEKHHQASFFWRTRAQHLTNANWKLTRTTSNRNDHGNCGQLARANVVEKTEQTTVIIRLGFCLHARTRRETVLFFFPDRTIDPVHISTAASQPATSCHAYMVIKRRPTLPGLPTCKARPCLSPLAVAAFTVSHPPLGRTVVQFDSKCTSRRPGKTSQCGSNCVSYSVVDANDARRGRTYDRSADRRRSNW